MRAGMTLPTRDEVDKKAVDINNAINYKFKDGDIEEVSYQFYILSHLARFLIQLFGIINLKKKK